MRNIFFSNVIMKDLSPLDFYQNERFDRHGLSEEFYEEFLKESLGDLFYIEELEDMLLEKVQVERIIKTSVKYIDANLPLLKDRLPFVNFEWKGKIYKLNVSRFNMPGYNTWVYYTIYKIANDCLQENKPLYLTIAKSKEAAE